ncbi:rhodanese-like domain-containing protein [Azospira restricta]|uniref:Rhodanese-like domain-containing protein n=1 Tax=Azospira restricta TaxID=404405 RepID=A0A974SPE0_9RHOO|nr:rhodanese-like domain-containing protein [Azospira restricta]QRJ64003.1 rhodanese-like domain-containing protein [Azospira restricta]
MGRLSEILQLARARAEAQQLPYAGALTPQEAHEVLQLAPGARLVDVRTRAEWVWVGRIPGAVEIEWQNWPEGATNPNFLAQLRQQVDREVPALFMCRSGVRSHKAAELAAANGWSESYNILEGFEGDRDAAGRRGNVGGWRKAGLPWTN